MRVVQTVFVPAPRLESQCNQQERGALHVLKVCFSFFMS